MRFRADVDLTVGCIYRQQVHYYQQLCMEKMVQFMILIATLCCQVGIFSSDLIFLLWCPHLSFFCRSAISAAFGHLLINDYTWLTDAQYSHARDVIATCLSVGWSVWMYALVCVFPVCVCVCWVRKEEAPGYRHSFPFVSLHIRCSVLSWNLPAEVCLWSRIWCSDADSSSHKEQRNLHPDLVCVSVIWTTRMPQIHHRSVH